MNKAQRATLEIAWIVVLTVNIPYLILRGYFYKGISHLMDSNPVSVYLADHDSKMPTVPLVNPTSTFLKTGQDVTVFLRNGYRDDEIVFAPRLTFALVFGFGILFALITGLTTKPSAATPP